MAEHCKAMRGEIAAVGCSSMGAGSIGGKKYCGNLLWQSSLLPPLLTPPLTHFYIGVCGVVGGKMVIELLAGKMRLDRDRIAAVVGGECGGHPRNGIICSI